jgi:hypothetical protein
MEYVFELILNYNDVLKENLEIFFFFFVKKYIVDAVFHVSYICKQRQILEDENDQNYDLNVVVLISVVF